MMIEIERSYQDGQMREFILKFEKNFPEEFTTIQKNATSTGISKIMMSLYESSIFDQVMA
jgi:hypothetical protein